MLRSDFLTQGPAIERFERKVAEHCGVRRAVAVSNATAALHIACLALDLGLGDVAWTSPNTFVASANCARTAVPMSISSISIPSLESVAGAVGTAACCCRRAGKLPKVLVPVHFSGQSCDMEAIGQLARSTGVAVIEDASHAIGARFGEAAVGSCQHSDCAVFSFHPVRSSPPAKAVSSSPIATIWRPACSACAATASPGTPG